MAHPEHRAYIYDDPDCWPDDCGGKGHYSIIAFTEIDPAAHASVTDYHPYVAGEPPIGPRGDAGMSDTRPAAVDTSRSDGNSSAMRTSSIACCRC